MDKFKDAYLHRFHKMIKQILQSEDLLGRLNKSKCEESIKFDVVCFLIKSLADCARSEDSTFCE